MNKHWDRDARTDGSVDQSQAQMQALAQQQAALIGRGKVKLTESTNHKHWYEHYVPKGAQVRNQINHKLKGTKSQINTVEGQKGEQQKQAINKEYV